MKPIPPRRMIIVFFKSSYFIYGTFLILGHAYQGIIHKNAIKKDHTIKKNWHPVVLFAQDEGPTIYHVKLFLTALDRDETEQLKMKKFKIT